jgi:hypothetical protein
MTPRRLFSQEVTWVKGGHVGKGRSGLGARPETRRVTDRQARLERHIHQASRFEVVWGG